MAWACWPERSNCCCPTLDLEFELATRNLTRRVLGVLVTIGVAVVVVAGVVVVVACFLRTFFSTLLSPPGDFLKCLNLLVVVDGALVVV